MIAAGTAIVFNVYQNVNAASKVDAEGESLRALNKNILDSYSASADYSSLTTERAIEDGLFPNTMMSDGTGEPVSTWGKPVREVAAVPSASSLQRLSSQGIPCRAIFRVPNYTAWGFPSSRSG